ncbi:hypothetical protein PACTADRAFT_185383 [Pachysolen tannophilus NRRL Y-2460]|uniref:Low temperature requirement protein A n=1 Tax=Pachysolen tannophilus NRRL Y-2460 TaxID=669874 RepID=A0A1E4U2R9_PACTA|nr:hypothetical protein PACTADRAFT_185383 [Pachysolen tannophilus NRRL Y-2460]
MPNEQSHLTNSQIEVDPRELYREEVEAHGGEESSIPFEETDFIQKYGAINVEYIQPPPKSRFFTRPHALNYFHAGKLYRTRNERSSSVLELFLDLLYVGIVAALASQATEKCDGLALLKYIILFIPVWTVWADLKDFMNYYYNDDLTQRLYVLWIMVLLVIYANNSNYVLESHSETAMVVISYMLCRYSSAAAYFFYSFYVMEHKSQIRLYSILIIITTCIWIPVIFIGIRAKIGLSIAIMFLEQLSFSMSFHPITKNFLKLEYSTALNIEHEVERFGAFYTIAIGEFLYGIVTAHITGSGINDKMWKAILVLIIGYIFMFLYFNGEGSVIAVHALRRNVNTSFAWIFLHIPLIGSLILVADASSELVKLSEIPLAKNFEQEISLYGLSFYFSAGICIALFCLGFIAMMDKPIDDISSKHVPKNFRILPRFPIGIIIMCLSFAELKPAKLLGLTTLLLGILFSYEIIVMESKKLLRNGCSNKNLRERTQNQKQNKNKNDVTDTNRNFTRNNESTPNNNYKGQDEDEDEEEIIGNEVI